MDQPRAFDEMGFVARLCDTVIIGPKPRGTELGWLIEQGAVGLANVFVPIGADSYPLPNSKSWGVPHKLDYEFPGTNEREKEDLAAFYISEARRIIELATACAGASFSLFLYRTRDAFSVHQCCLGVACWYLMDPMSFPEADKTVASVLNERSLEYLLQNVDNDDLARLQKMLCTKKEGPIYRYFRPQERASKKAKTTTAWNAKEQQK